MEDSTEEEIAEYKNISDNFCFNDIFKYIKNENLIKVLNGFKEEIEKDLNIPNALPYLYNIMKEKNISKDEILKSISIVDFILGLNIIEESKNINSFVNNSSSINEEIINKLIRERNVAKKEKNYNEADEIRNKLKNMGVLLEDTPNGTIWKKC